MNFPDFWKAYPHPKNRGSKAKAEQLYNALGVFQKADMLAGLEKYKAYVFETEWYQSMQAQRWLNPRAENWDSWADAEKGEDGDIRQIQKETRQLSERNRRRQQAADEKWRDRYEKQFGWRPS